MWPTYLRRKHYQMKAKGDLSSLFLMTFLHHCQGRRFPILGTSWRSVYTNQVGGPKLAYYSFVSLRGLDQFHCGGLFQPFRRVTSDCGLPRIASEGYLVIILSTFKMALLEHPFNTFNLLELTQQPIISLHLLLLLSYVLRLVQLSILSPYTIAICMCSCFPTWYIGQTEVSSEQRVHISLLLYDRLRYARYL